MSANVENMFYRSGQLPWHGLGVPIDEESQLSVEDGIKAAGLDWKVECKPIQTTDGIAISDNVAVVRDNDNSVLGVTGTRYTPLQNVTAFEWFQPYLDAKVCRLETAGSLMSGRKVWVLARIQSDNTVVVKGDEIAKYLMLSNSHDGTTAVRVGFTPIRIVCCNTLAQAHNNAASKLVRVKHSSKVETNLTLVRDTIDAINHEFVTTEAKYKYLASKAVRTATDLKKYVRIMLDVNDKAEGELSTRTLNVIDDIVKRFEVGKDKDIAGIRGTWWKAYNAYTEYLNWEYGHNANTRMNALWFGSNTNSNASAFNLALQMAG